MKPAERRSFEGWERIPGPAKRYRNTSTGEELSNRQYRQRFLYDSHKLETVAVQRGQPRTRYTRLLHARQEYLASHGVTANLRDVRQSDAMKQIIKTLKAETAKLERLHARIRKSAPGSAERRRLRKEVDELTKANGELARALADLGLRDPNATHHVGDS